MEGIDMFVKILVFVKILSQWGRGQEFRSLEVREASSSHLKIYIYRHITLQCQVRELDLDFGGSKQKLRLHEMTRCSGQLTDRQGSGQSADSNLAHFRPTKEWSPKK